MSDTLSITIAVMFLPPFTTMTTVTDRWQVIVSYER